MPEYTPPSEATILHQEDVEKVIDERIAAHDPSSADNLVEKVGGTIAVPASPGGSYVQAEVVALRTAIAEIIGKLEDSGLIDEA